MAQEDIEEIRRLIREELAVRQPEALVRHDLELRESLVRVEEELKHQRADGAVMEKGFEQIDKRSEIETLNTRFEQVDRHFEEMREDMSKRLEQVDKHFEAIETSMDVRFYELTRRIGRFMVWSFATTLTIGGLVAAAIKLL
ncbi:hypothetical protein MIT9_P2429 [Methylomarinovum caldicuralii]|uniref:DUF1640 domain-containing protein n=1 Tax=Methylomarinovum caldicuralii TaxID=438856 RepID=A0AAU9BVP7_9GAMM|nr:hypothetical protein [Methylomarinovum caldicuralii]BCX82841.1 hypothetical protein MIT9_P2429 [Methylomarinovum caldicuralii]